MKGSGIFSVTGRVIDIIDDTYGDNKSKRTVVVETDTGYYNNNEWNERLQAIPVEFFGAKVEAAMQVAVGDLVTADGKPSGRLYQGKYYGNYKAESICVQVSGDVPAQETEQKQESGDDDDLPF